MAGQLQSLTSIVEHIRLDHPIGIKQQQYQTGLNLGYMITKIPLQD